MVDIQKGHKNAAEHVKAEFSNIAMRDMRKQMIKDLQVQQTNQLGAQAQQAQAASRNDQQQRQQIRASNVQQAPARRSSRA